MVSITHLNHWERPVLAAKITGNRHKKGFKETWFRELPLVIVAEHWGSSRVGSAPVVSREAQPHTRSPCCSSARHQWQQQTKLSSGTPAANTGGPGGAAGSPKPWEWACEPIFRHPNRASPKPPEQGDVPGKGWQPQMREFPLCTSPWVNPAASGSDALVKTAIYKTWLFLQGQLLAQEASGELQWSG